MKGCAPVGLPSKGPAPEIVEAAQGGFLVKDEEEMAAMVPKAREIDPRDCRRSADRFPPNRVAAGYETVYPEVLEAGVGARQAVR